MKNIIKRTALITVLSLVAALLLAVFGIVAFAPKVAGDFCFNLGMTKTSIGCYERAYNNTGEFDDLLTLVDSAIFADDGQKVTDYGKLLVLREKEFDDYCAKEDVDKQDSEYSTFDYYTNVIMNVYYERGDKQKAAEFAVGNLPSTGYAENSALYNAVKMAGTDEEFVSILGVAYETSSSNLFTGYVKFKDDMRKLGYEFGKLNDNG